MEIDDAISLMLASPPPAAAAAAVPVTTGTTPLAAAAAAKPAPAVTPAASEASTGDTLTQEEEEEEWHFLGSMGATIVGIQYYTGEAHPGEFVLLKREPNNPYDANAVRVDNMNNQKVGHIKRQQAAALSPILDRFQEKIKVDATIPYPGNQWTMPLHLDFYGDSTSLATDVSRILKQRGLRLQNSPHATSDSSAAVAAAPVVVQTQKIDWRTQQKDLDSMFEEQSKAQLENLPPVDVSKLPLTTQLFDHQVQGIRWMVHREISQTPPPFYRQVVERNRNVWFSEITNSSQATAPKPICGGILADDMGLGKTIQAIGLILANPPEGRDYTVPVASAAKAASCASSHVKRSTKIPSKTAIKKLKLVDLQRVLMDAGMSLPAKKDDMVDACLKALQNGSLPLEQYYNSLDAPPLVSNNKTCITTLILCPVSVMSNWVSQIEAHVAPDTLRVATYHGPTRHDLCLDEIDVLIASYNTIAYDFGEKETDNDKEPAAKKCKSTPAPLFETTFHRILLDEAHMIRSSKTRTFRACTSLKADRRLCLTGTPLQNRPDDIQSLFSFLGVEPLADKNVFRRAISQPIQAGDEVGLARLRVSMSHVALRRNKTAANLDLPEKIVELRSIEWEGEHQAIHDTLFQTSQVAFRATLRGGDAEALKNYMSVLESLLRIRQACCSGVLIPKDRLERAEEVLKELSNRDQGKALSAEEGKQLLAKLKGTFEADDQVECAVCLTEMEENAAVILRSCNHIFCQTCIATVASTARSAVMCPLCRTPFQKSDMIEESAASKAAVNDDANDAKVPMSQTMDSLGPSPKVSAMLQAIEEMEPDEKGVIYSQFTKMLDEIERHLDANGHSCARIDGKKTAPQRIEAMKAFESDDGPRFMLCSLHAAGTGINLTRASTCMMMDTWWNQAAESQAFDRVHRIGQKRKVRVIRFVMAKSIEERMVALQESKAALGKGSMEKLKPEELRKARIGDLKSLFDLSVDMDDEKADE